MRYIVALIISVGILALGWTVSHSVMLAARQSAEAGEVLSSSRVLVSATAWFIRLLPFMVILLPFVALVIARVIPPRKTRHLS